MLVDCEFSRNSELLECGSDFKLFSSWYYSSYVHLNFSKIMLTLRLHWLVIPNFISEIRIAPKYVISTFLLYTDNLLVFLIEKAFVCFYIHFLAYLVNIKVQFYCFQVSRSSSLPSLISWLMGYKNYENSHGSVDDKLKNCINRTGKRYTLTNMQQIKCCLIDSPNHLQAKFFFELFLVCSVI